MINFRKAAPSDISDVVRIYDASHTEIERGRSDTGWVRGVYPTEDTAKDALARGDLFVAENNGKTVGTAIINHIQPDAYTGAKWEHEAPQDKVMVLHTLAVDPACQGHGIGSAFAAFFEDCARSHGCTCVRLDTQAKNVGARKLYNRLGYSERGIVPCKFNGIAGVQLVLMEKAL